MTERNRADVIVGIQWGDEGKGRIVDLYARDYDVVARFGGGDNAGHSIKVGDREIALRLVPSGVLNERVELFIGSGTVVNLDGLLDEFDRLSSIGVDVSRIKLSDRAHIVLPYHARTDRRAETQRGDAALGTTGRGIGPAYVDRVARSGIMLAELADAGALTDRIRANVRALSSDDDAPSEQAMIEGTLAAAARLKPHVVDGVAYIHERLESGKRVLIEGAQGTLLDVGFGTYPFVTSSHTIAGGACTGLGIGPSAIGRVIGIAKAYCTRVGAGPFPSELTGVLGERLRVNGNEFGTVTGRPRRCGWFDAVAARYAVRLNGLGAVALTKLDVLSGFETLGIVTDYAANGRSVDFGAAGHPGLDVRVETMPGWTQPLAGVRKIVDLPANARRYVGRIEELLRVPIELVSVGRERTELAIP